MPDKFHTSKSTVEQYEIINYFIRYRSRCFITRTPNFLKPLSKPKEKKKKILQISKTLSIRRSGVYYSKNSHENKRMSSRDESTLERIESDGFPLRRRSSWRGCPSAASRVSWKREKRKKKRKRKKESQLGGTYFNTPPLSARKRCSGNSRGFEGAVGYLPLAFATIIKMHFVQPPFSLFLSLTSSRD